MRWWESLIELVVMVGLAIGVLMFLASDPSYDELEKGFSVAFLTWLVSRFTTFRASLPKKEDNNEES